MQDIIDAVRQLPTRSEWRAGLDSILAALAPITRAAVPKRPRHRASIAPRIWHQGRPRPSTQKFAYRRRDDGEFRIPRRHLTFELRNIGGITEEPLTKAQGLQSIATALHEMPDCPERDILSAALASLCEPGAD
jgi:hypothetical protein